MQLYQTLKIYSDALDLATYVHKITIELEIYDESQKLRDFSVELKDLIVKGFLNKSNKDFYCDYLNKILEYAFAVQEEIDLLNEDDVFDSALTYSRLYQNYKNLAKDIYLLREKIINDTFVFDA